MSAPQGEPQNQNQQNNQQQSQSGQTPQTTQTQPQTHQPVVVQAPSQEQNQFFTKLVETLETLPEKVVDSFREAVPQNPPAQQNQGQQNVQTGNNPPATNQPTATPSNVPQSDQGQQAQQGGKKTFADWWFGKK